MFVAGLPRVSRGHFLQPAIGLGSHLLGLSLQQPPRSVNELRVFFRAGLLLIIWRQAWRNHWSLGVASRYFMAMAPKMIFTWVSWRRLSFCWLAVSASFLTIKLVDLRFGGLLDLLDPLLELFNAFFPGFALCHATSIAQVVVRAEEKVLIASQSEVLQTLAC